MIVLYECYASYIAKPTDVKNNIKKDEQFSKSTSCSNEELGKIVREALDASEGTGHEN